MSKRLQVDWTRCDGHGLCARLWAEGIELDEWGFPIVPDGPLSGDDVRGARRAALACPRLALRLQKAPDPAQGELSPGRSPGRPRPRAATAPPA